MPKSPVGVRRSAFRLETLGGFRLLGPDGPVEVRGSKLRALLAYLACDSGGPRSREQATALLWGSYFEAQAKQNLRAALQRLRRKLGPESIVSDDGDLWISPDLLACDACRLAALAEQGDRVRLREAAALYRGDFLAGLTLAEPAWEDWVGERRRQLRALAVEVLLKMGEDALVEGNFDTALNAGERATALDGFREDGHRLLMRALVGLDRGAEALRAYQTLRDRLKRELDAAPSEETARLAVSLRSAPKAAPEAAGDSRPSIAVLPFVDLGEEPDRDRFCDGVTEDVINELSRFRDLLVTDRDSSFAFRGDTVDPGEVRAALRVRYLLRGSVRRYGRRIRMAVQLVDAEGGVQIWAERYDREIQEIFVVQDELVRTIAATLVGWLERRGRERARRKPTTSLEAYECVIQGRAHFLRMLSGENRKARALFEQALTLDAGYAAAQAWLAETHLGDWAGGWTSDPRKSLELGRSLASAAVELDDTDSRTHTALARAAVWYRELELARHHFDRALALNPNDAWALASSARCHILEGRPETGLRQLEETVRLNPLGRYGYQLGIAYYAMGRYGEAVRALRPVKDPIDLVFAWLAASLARLERSEEASRAAADFRDAFERRRRDLAAAGTGDAERFLAERYPFRRESELEHLLDGLKTAEIKP